MKLGVSIFPTDKTIDPGSLAKAAEDLGFESLWFPEHSHIPTSRETPWGGRAGAPPLPEMYWRTHDQFVALMAAAASTSTLKVASGITLVAQRDPIWLAKQVATVDALSGGRLIFGIGYGWNKEELAHHGVEYTERRALLREKILMMKELWTQEEAAYAGDLIQLQPSWSWPKPTQQPHPPIIMGGAAGPKTFAHIMEFCDGWMPIYAHTSSSASLAGCGRLRSWRGGIRRRSNSVCSTLPAMSKSWRSWLPLVCPVRSSTSPQSKRPLSSTSSSSIPGSSARCRRAFAHPESGKRQNGCPSGSSMTLTSSCG